ncbi:MAG TPA: NADPH:quinone oxidoreductase family protein [Woeseiaceae bacterium]|nr:NADPH:quinone oxidoreductase family protein [Woeseiaceae bacterium]
MKALVCKAYGPTDDLVIEELADPEAGPGQLVVDVAAAGINFPDLLIVAGKYQDKTPPPFTPGNEAAGTVSAVGAGVRQFAVGDRVIVMPRGGAFAERCLVDERQAIPLPPGLGFVEAAGFGVAFGTSYHALKQCARLAAGETLLVLGAAGGVGVAAVELGKAMGARVIAAASTDEKVAYASAAGADATINYGAAPLREAVRELTGDDGVDVVYDPVGGDLAQSALRSLAWHGRYLVVGFASGDIPAFPANIALLKEASIIGVWWGTWLRRHPDEHQQNFAELMDWIADGTLKPKVTETYALDDYRRAFRRIAGRQARGKVVLRMGT